MENKLLYEGKAKKIFSTENPDELLVYYKDDATAGNGAKKGTIADKGILNNKITKTIISTNLGIKDIFNFYEERIGSRIAGYYDIYYFFFLTLLL